MATLNSRPEQAEGGKRVIRGIKYGGLLAVVAAGAVMSTGASAAAPAGGVTVYAGPNLQAPPPGVSKNSDALFFYPKVVTVHVGDAVTWQFRGFHTITFAGPRRPYPFIVPLGGKQAPVKDAAGQPLWWAGKVPVLGLSPLSFLQQGGSTISSPSQVRSSGLMRIFTATSKKPPAPYTLTFTKPGTYRYQCAVHEGMRGIVRVLPASATIPSAAAQEHQGTVELGHTIADVRRLGHAKPAKKLTILVGQGHGATGGEIAAFFPTKLVVNVGDTVTFRNDDQTDIHTVTFGPPKYTGRIENDFVAPHGKRILVDPLGAFPSEPPGTPTPQYDGTNHGHGYLGAGILSPKGAPAKAGPQTFKVTFTKAGTYHFECVIHQNMDGTVVVH
jgi:plastocyanin